MSDIKGARVGARRLALAGVILLTLAGIPWAQVDRPVTWGRRLSIGPSGLLLLTEPDPPARVVLYDVTGDAPRKVVSFGEPGWAPGQLESPHGAALNWAGELFVTNTYNHRIDVFETASLRAGRFPRLLRCFGAVGEAFGRFEAPRWPVAISSRKDLQHMVFVSDTANDRVQVFERTGKLLRVIGGHGTQDGRLDRPMALAFDPSGDVLYVAEYGNRRVSAISALTGRLVGKIGEVGLSGAFRDRVARPPGGLAIPHGLAVAPDGVVFVTDLGPRQVRRFKPRFSPKGAIIDVTELPAWGRPGTRPGEILKPGSIAVDVAGRVYVADLETDRCQMFSPEGEFLAAFGDDVSALTSLGPPFGLGPRLPEAVCSNDGSYRVRLEPSRNPVPAGEMMGLRASVLEGCGDGGAPAEGVGLRVTASMPEHQHGMTTQARVLNLGGGRFEVSGLLFHMPGHWELYFDVQREGVVERAQAEFRLE